MPKCKSKRSLYRTRTVRSITRTMQPVVSKYFIDFRADDVETTPRTFKAARQRNSFRMAETVLDRIISKLKRDYKTQDILLLITPASRHAYLYKMHAIHRHRQGHLGMTTITYKELCRLKVSKAFHKYCIVVGSRYIDLKTVVLQTETIKSLVSCINKKSCGESMEVELPAKMSNTIIKSNSSSAGDYLNAETVDTMKFQDSFIQTDPEIADDISFSLDDILQLIETINHTLEPCRKDIDRFFFMADKLKFSLVVRPELLWRTSCLVKNSPENSVRFQLESHLPSNCYLGCITMMETDLMQHLEMFPKLLLNTHVIEDVYDITPMPKLFVDLLRQVFGFLKLELLYDALGELIFDWYKNLKCFYLFRVDD